MNDSSSTAAPLSMSFLVLGAAHEVEARLEGALGQVGLSLAKFRVLSQLLEVGEAMPLGQLAERCSCVRSNMTQLVDRLEADRLVQRVADASDRRCVRAVLTDEGRRRHTEGARILEETEREVFARLGAPDRAALEHLVQLLRQPA